MDMMKAIIMLTIILVVFPLALQGQDKEYNVETESVSPYVDKILNGPITKSGLRKMPYKIWFNKQYKTYRIDIETLRNIKQRKLRGLKVLAFMGTWCHDSNREIPRLMRVIEKLGAEEDLELYGVDMDKTSLKGLEQAYDLKKTPTIIFLKKGKEIARILEKPEISFEQELAKILK